MKKFVLAAATCALTLWGCANTSKARSEEPEASMQELTNEKSRAQRDRMGAPTVYEGEATGGAGNAVRNEEGELWAPEVAPGNTVVRTPSDTQRSIERQTEDAQPSDNGSSEVIDEGPTKDAPQQ
ncbi:hypothetical protein [Cystobacter ferrugineus]|uniref:Lipoprotein n=1 Tax=Cystobacter ferrugineus TaxID=83449 RepID=A0A1L9B6H9_9BACT|nr:hypothetical protein [Cystobacter ferrugineus]OJH37858.1 hypothetical protein BON30_27195 [Cystobacter ferrugineus]